MPLWTPRCTAKPRVSRGTAVGAGRHHALMGVPRHCKTTRFAQYGGGCRAAPRPYERPAALQNHAFRAVRRWVAGGTMPFWAPRGVAKPRVSRSTPVGGVRHHAHLGIPLRCKTTHFAQCGGGWRAAPCPSGHPAALQNHAFGEYGGGWRAAPCPSGHPAALQNHAFRAFSRSTAVGGGQHHVLMGTPPRIFIAVSTVCISCVLCNFLIFRVAAVGNALWLLIPRFAQQR